MTKNIKAKVMS